VKRPACGNTTDCGAFGTLFILLILVILLGSNGSDIKPGLPSPV
jgi:hypothetical protein